MKPIKVVICGWGPYRDRTEIDFTRLLDKGIFLITGATGAGKTTIFDAITYALYGNMSGEMREKGSVRSDFAKEETPTYVELFMSHGKETFHILRNPEYQRPKKRKTGKVEFTKEKENAILTLPDGTAIEGNVGVNCKLQEILILDYKQFKQITMIAQGEFARLLVANPAEKARIFREIFGTSVYERFTSSLRDRAGKLYKQVSEYRHKLEEDIHLFSSKEKEWEELTAKGSYHYEDICAYLKDMEKHYKKQLTDVEKNIKEREDKILQWTTQIQQIKQINQIYEQLRDTQKKKDFLEERRSMIQELEQQISGAESAEKVKSAKDSWQREEKALVMQKEQRVRAEKQQTEISNFLQTLEPFSMNREILKKAVAALHQLEKIEESIGQQQKLKNRKSKEFKKLQEQYLEVEQATQEKKTAYETAERIYKRAVIGIVAKMVQMGEPCPVCGSLEHPQIAPLSEEVPEEEKIEELRLHYELSNQSKLEIYGQTVSAKGEVKRLEEQLLELQKDAECLTLEQKEWQQSLSVKNLVAVLEKETKKDVSKAETLEKKLENYRELQIRQQEKAAEITRLQEQEQAQNQVMEQRKSDFLNALEKYGFVSTQEYQNCVRTEEFVKKSKEEVKSFGEKERSISDLLLHFKESVAGKEEQDETPFYEQLANQKAEKEQEIRKQTEWNIQWNDAIKIRKSLIEKRKSMEKMEKEYGIIQDLSQLASGNNSKKLVFEQYVLAGYFEEILKAANLRFSKITGGRYELFRAEEVSDGRTKDNLEMIIMDYYTGRYRSVKTLSGGEAFKASLSLALGMSDVIQANSGGIRIEALFIDEGFGALDSESLEQACQTLNSLVEKDKIIGIISHVPELRERIDNQIVIEKSKYGSAISVI